MSNKDQKEHKVANPQCNTNESLRQQLNGAANGGMSEDNCVIDIPTEEAVYKRD